MYEGMEYVIDSSLGTAMGKQLLMQAIASLDEGVVEKMIAEGVSKAVQYHAKDKIDQLVKPLVDSVVSDRAREILGTDEFKASMDDAVRAKVRESLDRIRRGY